MKNPINSFKIIPSFCALSIGLFLASCGYAPVLVPQGNVSFGQTVSLDRAWSEYNAVFNGNNKKVKLLTLDGPALNSLYITEGLSPKDPLMIAQTGDRKDKPAPRGSENMSLSEQIDYVGRGLAEIGFLNVTTKSPKPVTVSGEKGVRFVATMRNVDGLEYQALAQVVTKNKLSYYVIYTAPSEHYYQANLKHAVSIMDSVKLP